MKTLIIGGAGQLGSAIVRQLRDRNFNISKPHHNILDITNHGQVVNHIKGYKPNVIINCSGYHDAQKCKENPDIAREVNVIAVEHLAQIANQFNAKLIHFSTDQVLKGPPVLQDESADTFVYDIYSQTKRESELVVPSNHTIIRVSALYGHDPCRGKDRLSFVEQVIKAIDEEKKLELPGNMGCSPGYVEDIAKCIFRILREFNQLPHIIHLSPYIQHGYSWFHFASDINREYKQNSDIPDESALITRKHVAGQHTGLVNMISRYHWNLPSVQKSLRRYLRKRRELQ